MLILLHTEPSDRFVLLSAVYFSEFGFICEMCSLLRNGNEAFENSVFVTPIVDREFSQKKGYNCPLKQLLKRKLGVTLHSFQKSSRYTSLSIGEPKRF